MAEAEKPPPSEPGRWDTLSGIATSAMGHLAPYGPTPVVAVALTVSGLIALTAGAAPLATVTLVLSGFGAYFFGQERKAHWAIKEQEAEYDRLERQDAREARLTLERRMQLPGSQAQSQPIAQQGSGQ